MADPQQDAYDRVRAVLQQYGLDRVDVLEWARQALIDGKTESSMMLDLYDPNTVPGKVVNTLYPELKMRRDANLGPISIAAAVDYRDKAVQMFRAAGLPKTFFDQPADLANFVGRDVSLAELQDRVNEGMTVARMAPAETRAQMEQLYGVDLGHLTAYFLDPARALPLLKKQEAAATLSGAGVRSGFGGLNRVEAERLATLGVSDQQASQAFGALVQNRELFGALPGQSGEPVVSRGQQLGAAFAGDEQALSLIERKRRARQAVFGGRGGLSASQAGVGGLGSAAS